jgi:hypothetical protein
MDVKFENLAAATMKTCSLRSLRNVSWTNGNPSPPLPHLYLTGSEGSSATMAWVSTRMGDRLGAQVAVGSLVLSVILKWSI